MVSGTSDKDTRLVMDAVAACFCFIQSLKSRMASLGTSTIGFKESDAPTTWCRHAAVVAEVVVACLDVAPADFFFTADTLMALRSSPDNVDNLPVARLLRRSLERDQGLEDKMVEGCATGASR
jgi:hypothetical protein